MPAAIKKKMKKWGLKNGFIGSEWRAAAWG